MSSDKAKDFPALLKQSGNEIAKAVPTQIKPERMMRVALTAFRRNPKLAECTPVSVLAAVIQSCQLGLEPDTLGRSFLVPYYDKTNQVYNCQFIPGWKGLVDLVNNSGNVTVWTGAEHEGDAFAYGFGSSPFIDHIPGEDCDTAELKRVYAVGRIEGNKYPIIDVWSVARVKKHLERYNKVGDRHYAHENFEMYARKVVLLQVLKYLPASPQLREAISLNDAAEIGAQRLNPDGSWDMGETITGTQTPSPKQKREEKEIPVMTKAEFEKKKTLWKGMINSGQKASEIIKFVESKTTLTEEQQFEIHSWEDEKDGNS